MADPATYRPAAGTIPVEPGVYTFRDASNRVLYVGKAKNLRARLSNYFQDPAGLHPRTRQMVFAATHVKWTVVASEDEALNLEYTWIKRYQPRYNVMFRDDKSYPMIAVSLRDIFPRVWIYRGVRRKGTRYFGPFPKKWQVKDSLESLTRVFPIRTCTNGVFHRHELLGRPCLLGYIDKCSAPCVGNISAEDHQELVRGLCSVLGGDTRPIIRELTEQMEAAAEAMDFETAAARRDDIAAITHVTERQAIVLGQNTDADLIAVASDELEAAVQIFYVRNGRIHGQRSWVVEKAGDTADSSVTTESTSDDSAADDQASDDSAADDSAADDSAADDQASDDPAVAALLREFLLQYYRDEVDRVAEEVESRPASATTGADDLAHVRRMPVPPEILVAVKPDDHAQLTTHLARLRNANVDIRVPQRGDKRALMDTVKRNAAEALHQHKLRRVGDITARSAALSQLQEALELDESPLRIECIDISHLAGTEVVASLVVFEDGLPKKSDYRRYRIKEAAGDGHSDDVASIAEITRRRFARHKEDATAVPDDDGQVETAEGTSRRFAYPPQLFIVDGGKPQVNAAYKAMQELGIDDVALCGIAKRLEEIWLPGDDFPVILPRQSEALYLVQQLRDEAHRVAITYQRSRRTAGLRASVLDDIPGLGQQRKKDLLKAFGSVAKIRGASVEDIEAVPGFGPKLARTVHTALTASD